MYLYNLFLSLYPFHFLVSCLPFKTTLTLISLSEETQTHVVRRIRPLSQKQCVSIKRLTCFTYVNKRFIHSFILKCDTSLDLSAQALLISTQKNRNTWGHKLTTRSVLGLLISSQKNRVKSAFEVTYSQVWYIIGIVSLSPTDFHSKK